MNIQKGFAHAVLIIGLTIAIIGALGFIFWQNFLHKEPTATNTEFVRDENNGQNSSETVTPTVVNEDDYSFTVADGFKESPTQMFTYTGSLRSVKTFINNEGDYFEVLIPQGGGGGISGDYFWNYTVKDSTLSVTKSDRCSEGDFACTADNSSVEGIISDANKTHVYYLGFGNKSKNEISLSFVDEFVSTFRLK